MKEEVAMTTSPERIPMITMTTRSSISVNDCVCVCVCVCGIIGVCYRFHGFLFYLLFIFLIIP